MPKKRVVYTDGACLRNPGPGGWAWVEYENGGKVRERSDGEPSETTNNRMELTAVIMALEELDDSRPIEIHTDSTYVANGITRWIESWKSRGWMTSSKEPVKNKELWERLDRLVGERGGVKFVWVKGHADSEGNNEADRLAQDRAMGADVMMAQKERG